MLFRSDRKSTRLNSSHTIISYAVFCLKKKNDPSQARDAGVLGGLRRPPAQRGGRLRRRARTAGERTKGGRAMDRTLIFFFLMIGRPPNFTLFPYPTLSR